MNSTGSPSHSSLPLVVLERLRSPIEGFRTLDEIAATIFGFIYCVLLFAFIPKILMLPLTNEAGESTTHYYLIYLIAVTKLTDMGAYLVGSLIGRDKMVPHVSPGKTWQGFGGAIAFAVAGSFTLYFAMGDQIPIITPHPCWSPCRPPCPGGCVRRPCRIDSQAKP